MPEINHQTYIKVSIDKVFKTLSTAEGWNAWFTNQTSLHMEQDGTGEIRLKWDGFGQEKLELEDGGRILRAVKDESFVFQWSPGEMVTTVEFKLEPYQEGTLIMLKEMGYSNSDKDIKACINCAVGWGEAMTLLKIYLEEGIVYKEDL
ncbi:SRPBCC domain-containing protein [Psychrobacillus sp. FSL K6-2684]|uniref:SRPBCC family protein n=1 Tax=unclassified Psychrobacillus TaxID=2636677 RepID=UPI0030FCBDE8